MPYSLGFGVFVVQTGIAGSPVHELNICANVASTNLRWLVWVGGIFKLLVLVAIFFSECFSRKL